MAIRTTGLIVEHVGTSVGSVPSDPKKDPTPSVDVSPAAAEQQALDESYKSGDSPYEFSKVRPSLLACLLAFSLYPVAAV